MICLDIDMPESCVDCPCSAFSYELRGRYCNAIEKIEGEYCVSQCEFPTYEKRSSFCPLKSLEELQQEVRELTIDEWREWKANPKRNPICKLWENDTSPMWILDPNDVHEPALLMGKLKLFTGKPTFEQCKEVKWE